MSEQYLNFRVTSKPFINLLTWDRGWIRISHGKWKRFTVISQVTFSVSRPLLLLRIHFHAAVGATDCGSLRVRAHPDADVSCRGGVRPSQGIGSSWDVAGGEAAEGGGGFRRKGDRACMAYWVHKLCKLQVLMKQRGKKKKGTSAKNLNSSSEVWFEVAYNFTKVFGCRFLHRGLDGAHILKNKFCFPIFFFFKSKLHLVHFTFPLTWCIVFIFIHFD